MVSVDHVPEHGKNYSVTPPGHGTSPNYLHKLNVAHDTNPDNYIPDPPVHRDTKVGEEAPTNHNGEVDNDDFSRPNKQPNRSSASLRFGE